MTTLSTDRPADVTPTDSAPVPAPLRSPRGRTEPRARP